MVSYKNLMALKEILITVLILIVVEDGLVRYVAMGLISLGYVLILIVVEDGLVHSPNQSYEVQNACLNPYCSGRWSRTYGC